MSLTLKKVKILLIAATSVAMYMYSAHGQLVHTNPSQDFTDFTSGR